MLEYDLEIKHCSVIEMEHVDASSRAPVNESEIVNVHTLNDEILMFQRSDTKILEIIKILQKRVNK